MKPSNFKSRLLISVVMLLIVMASIWGGYFMLRKYSSEEYVLAKSIENIGIERQNATKTRKLLLDSSLEIDNLKQHNIYNVDQIPVVVETLESYADIMKVPIFINNIGFVQPDKTKPKVDENGDSAPGSLPKPKSNQKELAIDISTYGDFDNMLKMIKLFENADYILKMPQYTFKQVIMPDSLKDIEGEPPFVDVNSTNINSSSKKVWLLKAKLTMQTNIN